MKIEIKRENNAYTVSDEFGLINEEFKTFEEADKFLKSKLSGAVVARAIYYATKRDISES